jgi:hypothetical protein
MRGYETKSKDSVLRLYSPLNSDMKICRQTNPNGTREDVPMLEEARPVVGGTLGLRRWTLHVGRRLHPFLFLSSPYPALLLENALCLSFLLSLG